MIKICPLEWTDLNPTAPSFVPKDFPENKSKEINENKSLNKSLTANGLTSASTSKTNVNKKNKKPSTLTLEQFIAEKLKIDNKKESNIGIQKTQKKVETNGNKIPHNLLDSSAPTRKRGKEREIPKPKKPTTLKRIINNEKNSLNSNQQNSDEKEILNKDLNEINKRLLHSKTFREYCFQRLSPTVDQLVVNLLSDLVLFQDRMYSRDPMKAKIKKRLSFGFKEVTKYANINKIKLLVIAPDIEKIESKGGLDDNLLNLIKITHINGIPIVFALSRQRLAITCKKKGLVSCVGVLSYDGSQENFKQLISLCEMERTEYNLISEQSLNELKCLTTEQIDGILEELPNIPQQFVTFRIALNPSDRRLVKLKKTLLD